MDQQMRDRRWAASLVVVLVWVGVSLLHRWPQLQPGLWGLTAVLTLQALRMGWSRAITPKLGSYKSEPCLELPTVSIIVPAQNEAAVLPALIPNVFQLDYPAQLLEVWVVDDGSTDTTVQVLATLQTQFPQLQVLRRQAQGGKSGALNAVLPMLNAELVLICDADAQLSANFLQETVPIFHQQFQQQFWKEPVAAVQVRKTISPLPATMANNFWLNCLEWEFCCDAALQSHRLAAGGLVEFRGNGMLVQRSWLERCGGWNEDTVTDDLDLAFKLSSMGAKIVFVTQPAIQEEGITTWAELWPQRCRWAEGGYQRYFDYAPQLLRLPWFQIWDLALFLGLQFLLPIGLIPDLLWSMFYSHHSILWPLQTLFGVIVAVSFAAGLYQFQQLRGWRLLGATLIGCVYMLHWIPIMVLITHRACIQRHPSPWSKTVHRGYHAQPQQEQQGLTPSC